MDEAQLTRGLHGLKIEARTRPVPEIVWPDLTQAAQINLERARERPREMDESCVCEPASVRLFELLQKQRFYPLIAEKYNESVAYRSYFTNKSCHAVSALRNLCVQ